MHSEIEISRWARTKSVLSRLLPMRERCKQLVFRKLLAVVGFPRVSRFLPNRLFDLRRRRRVPSGFVIRPQGGRPRVWMVDLVPGLAGVDQVLQLIGRRGCAHSLVLLNWPGQRGHLPEGVASSRRRPLGRNPSREEGLRNLI